MKITINKVNIKSFRNIKNTEYTFSELGGNVAISGGNALGKTNTLNAIMWCLTGSDLFGNATKQLNVPNDYDSNEISLDCPVDVEVELNVGTIERTYDQNGKEVIYINGNAADTLKNGETLIDQMLGTLQLSIINKSKKFDVRKFLLNPLYIKQVATIDFRKFVLSLINEYVNQKDVLLTLGDSVLKLLEPYNPLENDINTISDNLSNEKKNLDNLLKEQKIVLGWLQKHHKELEKDITDLQESMKSEKKALNGIEEVSIALDRYAIAVSKAYNEFCERYFDGINFCLLEKGVTEDVWKNVCYPYIPNTKLPFDQGSTSEQIRLGCLFTLSVIKKFSMTNTLPLLFDECETLDYKSLNIISKQNDTQLITACVVPSLDHIEIRRF